jgi:hypothetical protein
MREHILDIQLMNRPLTRKTQTEHSADGGKLNDRAESLGKVNLRALSESSEDPTSLIAVKGAIWIEFVLENPFIGDDIGTKVTRDESPGRAWYSSSIARCQ